MDGFPLIACLPQAPKPKAVVMSAEQALGRVVEDARPHVVLVDGSPLVFRAHFAMDTALTRKDGTVVTAVFGFTRLLLKLRAAIDADYCAVFLDDKRPTFRKDMYEAYKVKTCVCFCVPHAVLVLLFLGGDDRRIAKHSRTRC